MIGEVSTFETDLAENIELSDGVCFDPDNVSLRGCYSDELSAHRAKRLWVETLENCFLLEEGHDFSVRVRASLEKAQFVLVCEFGTACARYAFWRLTNNQAPEAQYVIETAHIPVCDSRQEDILRAPDMKSIHEEPFILRGSGDADGKSGLSGLLRTIIDRFKA